MAAPHLARVITLTLCTIVTGGCSETTTTEVGPLGKAELKAHWPDKVPATPTELDSHTTTWEFCDADPFPAAEAKINWRAFRVGGDGYVVDYDVELTRSSPNLVVALSTDSLFHGSVNLTPGDPYLGVTEVHVKCEREAYRGIKKYTQSVQDTLQLVADGTVRE